MSTLALLSIAGGSIALLLVLIIRLQVHAFVALMLVSLLVALATNIPVGEIIPTLIAGMGGTLGSVAILVALGAMLGRMIEVSGGANTLAQRFTQILGPRRVPAALTAAALVLSIPVFFDVGFIILIPIIYGFCKAAGVNPVKYGLPVAGIMLATHVVVPPHPGIVGGAAVLSADVGWITLIGLATCIPLAFLAQYVGGKLNRRDYVMQPDAEAQFRKFGTDASTPSTSSKLPSVAAVLTLILAPLALIMLGTTGATLLPKGDSLRNLMSFTGAPVFALMVAIGLAFVLLVRPLGWTRTRTNEVMESALPAAATVILVTGAGGVFAKVLTVSGIGTALSQALAGTGLPLILLAESINGGGYSALQVAILTVAIGFGGLGLSHVNDSGFWIVTRYLGLSVADGLRSWTVLTTILGLAGFLLTWLIWVLAS